MEGLMFLYDDMNRVVRFYVVVTELWSHRMINKNELAMLEKAIEGEVSRLKRGQNSNGPGFKEVYDRILTEYTALTVKLRSMADEEKAGFKK